MDKAVYLQQIVNAKGTTIRLFKGTMGKDAKWIVALWKEFLPQSSSKSYQKAFNLLWRSGVGFSAVVIKSGLMDRGASSSKQKHKLKMADGLKDNEGNEKLSGNGKFNLVLRRKVNSLLFFY